MFYSLMEYVKFEADKAGLLSIYVGLFIWYFIKKVTVLINQLIKVVKGSIFYFHSMEKTIRNSMGMRNCLFTFTYLFTYVC